MDDVVFSGKRLSDVFQDIYRNTDTKREQINSFILKLTKLVMTPDDAVLIAPIIKDFMEVNVKNDEHIVKVAQIAQRAMSIGAQASSVSDFLTDAEKAQILGNISSEIKVLQENIREVEDEIEQTEYKTRVTTHDKTLGFSTK